GHSAKATRASTVREEIAKLSSEVERLRSFLQQSETNLGDLVQRIDNARSQIASLEAEATEQQALLEEKSRQLEAAREERNRIRDIADQLERDRQEKSDEVRRFEKSLADSRESLMRTIARISEARNQVHQIEIAVEKCEFYLSKLDETARRALESRDGARSVMNEWQQRVVQAEQALIEAQQTARDALSRRDDLSSRRDALRESLASTRDRVSQTTYKIDSLRTLLTSLESQDEAVRAAVLELIPNATAAAEAVRAAEGFEAALDTLLREVSKAVVVETGDTAIEAIRRLRERGAGRGAFITTDFAPTGEGSRRGNAAYSVVGEGAIADAVRHAIPEAYIVGNLREAIDRAKERPNATFVTLDGDIVRGPLVIGGKTEGATPGVFSLKRELSDLEALVGAEETRASSIATELQSLEEELRSADDARILADERARAAEQELRDRKNQRERAASELQRLEKDLAVASEEQMLYAEEKDGLLARKTAALDELQRLEQTETETQAQIRGFEEQLAVARTAFEEVTEVASKSRVDLEAASGNVNAIAREHENLSRIVVSLGSRSTQLQQEIETLTKKQGDTGSAAETARGQLDESLAKLHELSEMRVALEAEVADLDVRVKELSSRAVNSREQWNLAKDTLFESQRRHDHAKSAFDLLREQIALDLHAGIDALADVEPPASDEARAELESEVNKLTDSIEKIGPVNVLAIDEHQELETRESFLRTQ